ncbi:MAG: hypothetical protein RSF67_08700, partial [Clostridia bacterium]
LKLNKVSKNNKHILNSVQEDLKYKSKLVDKYIIDINNKDTYIADLNKIIKDLNNELLEKQVNIEKLENVLKHNNKEFNSKIQSLELELNSLNLILEENVNVVIKELQDKNDELSKKLELKKSDIRKNKEIIQHINKTKENNKEKIKELEEINKEVWSDVVYFSGRVEELYNELQKRK